MANNNRRRLFTRWVYIFTQHQPWSTAAEYTNTHHLLSTHISGDHDHKKTCHLLNTFQHGYWKGHLFFVLEKKIKVEEKNLVGSVEGEEDKGWGQVEWGIHFNEHISRQKSLSKLGLLYFITKLYRHGDAWGRWEKRSLHNLHFYQVQWKKTWKK